VSPVNPNHRVGALSAFQAALTRESHVLSRHPDLLWQQLYNRLRWRGGAVAQRLRPEAERRERPGCTPWLRARIPPRESDALLATYSGHADQVRCCAVSPDGALVVSGGLDGVHVWELASARLLVSMEGSDPGKRIHLSCAISPDQRMVAAGDGEGFLAIWDIKSGRLRKRTLAHEGGTNACVFDPVGLTLVSCGQDGAVIVWDVETLERRSTWEGHQQGALDLTMGPGGTSALSVGGDRTLRLWDLVYGHRHQVFQGEDHLQSCSMVGDGTVGVVGGVGELQVWDLRAGTRSTRFPARLSMHRSPKDDVHACLVSPDGLWVAVALGDNTLSIFPWPLHPDSDRVILEGHGGPVFCCSVTPDGSRLVSGSLDGTLKVWDTAAATKDLHRGRRLRRIKRAARFVGEAALETLKHEYGVPVSIHDPVRHEGPVNDCAFGPDGTWVATASDDSDVIIWSAETGGWVRTLGFESGTVPVDSGHRDLVGGVSVSGDGSSVVSAGDDGFFLWDVTSGHRRMTLGLTEDRADWAPHGRRCSVNPDASLVVAVPLLEDYLVVWRVRDGKRVASLERAEGETARDLPTDSPRVKAAGVTDCTWSRDGRMIVSSHLDGTLSTWSPGTWEESRRHGEARWPPARTCAVCETGRILALGDEEGNLTVVKSSGVGRRLRIRAHAGAVHDCSLSPDGTALGSVGDDGFLRIWRTGSSMTCVASVPLPSTPLCVDFSPVSPVVAAGDGAGHLHVFDLLGAFFHEAERPPLPDGNRPSTMVLPPTRHERYEWLQRMKIQHLRLPPTGRPPVWFCMVSLVAKGLSGVAGLSLGIAGLVGIAVLTGQVPVGTLLPFVATGAGTLVASLALLFLALGPEEDHPLA